jgi:hypothetical protein
VRVEGWKDGILLLGCEFFVAHLISLLFSLTLSIISRFIEFGFAAI